MKNSKSAFNAPFEMNVRGIFFFWAFPWDGRALRFKSSPKGCGLYSAIPNVGERVFTILRLHFDTRGFGCSPKLPAPRPARKSSPAFVRQPTLFKVVFYNIFYQ